MNTKAEIISHLDNIYIVLPASGVACALFIEQLGIFNNMDVILTPIIKSDPSISDRIGPGVFCIELLGPEKNKVNPFLYELFQVFINNNLQEFLEADEY